MATQRNFLVFIGVAAIMLILGLALGSTLFVMRITQTITQKTTQTSVQTTTQVYTVSASNSLGSSSTSPVVMLIGTCNATEYVLPDSLSMSVRNITTVSNHTTTVYASTTFISPTVETLNSSSYTTTLLTNTSTYFVTTNTTEPNPGLPAPPWIVATCTFAP